MKPACAALILSLWVTELTAPPPVSVKKKKNLLISQTAAANLSLSQSESDETACKRKKEKKVGGGAGEPRQAMQSIPREMHQCGWAGTAPLQVYFPQRESSTVLFGLVMIFVSHLVYARYW